MIRRAQPGDEPRLREVAAAAKGHWGYDADQVAAWAASLDLAGREEMWVAVADERLVAWVALLPRRSAWILEDLWVDPPLIGRGVGTALFRFAAERARELGANRLQWESEPNAVGFYEKVGAVRTGTTLGSWGRELPVMELDLGR